jgi:hypothetical protein
MLATDDAHIKAQDESINFKVNLHIKSRHYLTKSILFIQLTSKEVSLASYYIIHRSLFKNKNNYHKNKYQLL